MKTYSLTDARNLHGEVFDQALQEPILLTKKARPSHVILSAQAYQKLVDRLTDLEDSSWAQAADTAQRQSKSVGTERFMDELELLAHGEA
jgi:prevent-host-death family protein